MTRHGCVNDRELVGTLPSTVDPEKIEANYVHGVLAIQMPKRAEARPKQIKVNVTKALKAA
ncbi:MAG: Hsp20 family protein [Candidatus Sulfotelmatobacter sp.]